MKTRYICKQIVTIYNLQDNYTVLMYYNLLNVLYPMFVKTFSLFGVNNFIIYILYSGPSK